MRNHPEECSAIGRATNQSEADETSKKREIMKHTHATTPLAISDPSKEEKVIPNQYLYSSHTQRTNITQPTRQRRRHPNIQDQKRIICKKSEEEWINQVSTSLSTAGRTMEFDKEATQRQSATIPASNGFKRRPCNQQPSYQEIRRHQSNRRRRTLTHPSPSRSCIAIHTRSPTSKRKQNKSRGRGIRSGGVTWPASTVHPGSQDEAGRNPKEEPKINPF